MIIGILTWHKALNHGAVLQAYASQSVLNSLHYSAVVLDYDRKVPNIRLTKRLRNLVKRITSGDMRYRRRWQEFDKNKRTLFDNFIKNYLNTGKSFKTESVDKIMIGSDMVFNIKQGFSPYMFGYELAANVFFSYAASAGGTRYSLAEKTGVSGLISEGLKKFTGLGYRDKETADFIIDVCGRDDLVYNIDPVLLYGFEKEKEKWDNGKWAGYSPYILVYAYHGCFDSKKEIEAVKGFAEKKNLKIISCGYYHHWCDESINASPEEFLEMFKNAQFIVTDTFHGTVFSLICRKNFVSMIRNNSFKVKDLLDRCGYSKRIATDATQIPDVLSEAPDYTHFDYWIDKERKNSLAYLEKQCKGTKKKKE